MSEQTLLACFAHPDDESFGAGGVLALYAARGATVHLICATGGEEGEIADPALATPDNLGEVRRGELEEAARILGTDLELLGYRDSGMAGTDANRDSRAYVQAPAGEVVGRLVASMRRVKPNVVVTFDAHGGYGHPDHIAIHHHTVEAVEAAGDPNRYPEAGPAWRPRRLFFTAIPQRALQDMVTQLKAAGVDTSELERPDMPIFGQPDEDLHVILDVTPVRETKRQAVNAHRTQLSAQNPLVMFPKEFIDWWMGTEYYTLGWGTPLPESDGPATDLFAGL